MTKTKPPIILLKKTFIEYATKHGSAFKEGKSRVANRLFDKMTAIYQQIKNEEALSILYELINDPNKSVRFWASKYLLENDEEVALEVLNKLKQSKTATGLYASVTIDMWRKRTLSF